MNLYYTLIEMVEQSKAGMPVLFIMLGIVWGCYFLTLLSGYKLLYLGIHPRKLKGLPGIIFSPFLHAGFNHIFFNSVPLFLLSNFILITGLDYYLNVTFYLLLGSGVLVWLFGRPLIHVGASSIITGYWSFLVINAYHVGGPQAIILAALSAYYFIGIFFGIFPSDKGVSWEGHLFGFITGVALNYSLKYLPFFQFSQLISLYS